jgi:hypothetical protein
MILQLPQTSKKGHTGSHPSVGTSGSGSLCGNGNSFNSYSTKLYNNSASDLEYLAKLV